MKSFLKYFCASLTIRIQIKRELPAIRGSHSLPFSKTLYYDAYQYICKERNRKDVKLFKNYISIFVWFSICDFHLEYISNLRTSTFLEALKKYVTLLNWSVIALQILCFQVRIWESYTTTYPPSIMIDHYRIIWLK